jgi:hypothetical protein
MPLELRQPDLRALRRCHGPAWLKRILCGHGQEAAGNDRETGFQNSQTAKGFQPPRQTERNRASRRALYPRLHARSADAADAESSLREYAVRRGWTIAMQVKEVGSGASQRQMRVKLIKAARHREIDVVLVWRLDRWGRSVTDLLATLQDWPPC